jgi:hypothetical protein
LISGVLGGAGRRRQAQLDDLEGLGVPRRFMPPGSESAFVEQRDDALGNGAQGGRGGPRIRQQKAIALRLGQQIDGDRVHPVQQILKASVRQNPLGVDGERGIVVQTASQMVTGHTKHFVRGGRELRFGLTQNAETGFREALDTVRPGHRQGPPKESRENVRQWENPRAIFVSIRPVASITNTTTVIPITERRQYFIQIQIGAKLWSAESDNVLASECEWLSLYARIITINTEQNIIKLREF